MQIACFKPSPSVLLCLCRSPPFRSSWSAPVRGQRHTAWGGQCVMYRAWLHQGSSPAQGHGAGHQISEQDTFHCGLFLLWTWVWSCQSLDVSIVIILWNTSNLLTLCCPEKSFLPSPSSTIRDSCLSGRSEQLALTLQAAPSPRGMH